MTLDELLARIAELDAKANKLPIGRTPQPERRWILETADVLHELATALPELARHVKAMREALERCVGRDGYAGLYALGVESVSGLDAQELSDCVATVDSIIASARKALEESPYSSRMCERGVAGCDVRHKPQPDRAGLIAKVRDLCIYDHAEGPSELQLSALLLCDALEAAMKELAELNAVRCVCCEERDAAKVRLQAAETSIAGRDAEWRDALRGSAVDAKHWEGSGPQTPAEAVEFTASTERVDREWREHIVAKLQAAEAERDSWKVEAQDSLERWNTARADVERLTGLARFETSRADSWEQRATSAERERNLACEYADRAERRAKEAESLLHRLSDAVLGSPGAEPALVAIAHIARRAVEPRHG